MWFSLAWQAYHTKQLAFLKEGLLGETICLMLFFFNCRAFFVWICHLWHKLMSLLFQIWRYVECKRWNGFQTLLYSKSVVFGSSCKVPEYEQDWGNDASPLKTWYRGSAWVSEVSWMFAPNSRLTEREGLTGGGCKVNETTWVCSGSSQPHSCKRVSRIMFACSSTCQAESRFRITSGERGEHPKRSPWAFLNKLGRSVALLRLCFCRDFWKETSWSWAMHTVSSYLWIILLVQLKLSLYYVVAAALLARTSSSWQHVA